MDDGSAAQASLCPGFQIRLNSCSNLARVYSTGFSASCGPVNVAAAKLTAFMNASHASTIWCWRGVPAAASTRSSCVRIRYTHWPSSPWSTDR
uniref:Uncharacterized protein n=1 Tax=Arundo donax TaxID=35708 RepID=A0A0A9I2M3_ARUDO